MGSTYCKTANSLKLPSLEKIINCPLQFCPETHMDVEGNRIPRVRKFSTSDISGPLPLGTVITPPKRPPRKRRCKITRSCSVGELFIPVQQGNMVRSKSSIELRLDDSSQHIPWSADQQHNIIITCQPISTSALSQTTIVHQCTSSAVLAVHQEEPEHHHQQTTQSPNDSKPTIIIPLTVDSNQRIMSASPVTVQPILPPPRSPKLYKIEEKQLETEEEKCTPSSQIQGLISQNKKTFLATLLEQNNNLRCSDSSFKDINNSRKSSITESLREFESSLYEMLQENANKEEDQCSEHSLHLQHLSAR